MDATPDAEPPIHLLFRMVRRHGASGLELRTASSPRLWLRGEQVWTDLRALTAEDFDRLLAPILSPEQRERWARGEGVAFAYSVKGQRFWVTAARVGSDVRVSALCAGPP